MIRIERFDEQEEKAVLDVLRKADKTLSPFSFSFLGEGSQIYEFEREFASWLGRKYTVCVNSGTSALMIALKALLVDNVYEKHAVQQSRAQSSVVQSSLVQRSTVKSSKVKCSVAIPSYTFIADSEAVLASGCNPWFADIDHNTYCMNDWNAKNKIVIPVHTLGNMVDAQSIKFWHDECDVSMIEDCAQNVGGSWKNRKAGTFGDIAMFSGQGTKNLGGGELGWCCTDNEELAERMRSIRNHSDYYSYTNRRKFDLSMVLGYNLRPSEFSAAIAKCQLRKLDRFLQNFERNAKLIFDLLPSGIDKPYYPKEVKPAWFILGCIYKGKHRDKFLEKLWEERRKARMLFSDKTPDIPGSNQPPSYSIGSGYKHLLHELPLYQKFKRNTPNADYVRNNIVWFDIHRWSDEERVKANMEIVNRVYKEIEG